MTVAAEQLVETIECEGETLAVIVRRDFEPPETAFVTPSGFLQQLGFIVYHAGTEVPRHDHRPVERTIRGTPECLLIRRGRTEVTLYDRARREVESRTLEQGDIILLVAGGHGFRQIEDTVFLEIKQGPYPGVDEKERF